MNRFLRYIKRFLWFNYIEAKTLDLKSLPKVGLGNPLTTNDPFKGVERPFYELYLSVLGREKTNEILRLYAFERSALYGLHNEAIKVKAIPKTQLLDLSDGNAEMLGFAFQLPSLAASWEHPFEHYRAESVLGKAIHQPVAKK